MLEEKITADGKVLGTDILKVDMFLNHQLDVSLLDEMGREFFRLFGNDGVTKILTVEASGIALAVLAARYFGVPVVFAKKASHKNVGDDIYSTPCYSFTHGEEYSMNVSKAYLSAEDRILIIDDFLADGNAVGALRRLIEAAGAGLAGVGIGIEKGFQDGGKKLRREGVKLRSLAIIAHMDEQSISFVQQ